MLNSGRDDGVSVGDEEKANGEDNASKCLNLVQTMLRGIEEMRRMAPGISINKTSFLMMAFHLSELTPLLESMEGDHELLKMNSIQPLLQRLAETLKDIHDFMRACSCRSRIFLLFNSNEMADQIKGHFNQLSLCLGSVLAGVDLPRELESTMQSIQAKFTTLTVFQESGYRALSSEISTCLGDAHCDEARATALLLKIAEHLHVPEFEAAELKQELRQDLEKAMANRLSVAESLRALNDLFSSAQVLNERRRLASLDSELLPSGSSSIPSSFFCPITKSIMREPVMIAEEGFTYEKSAILEWFDRGHRTCPDTGRVLQNLTLVPNLKLQQAMDEFFDHMYQAQMVYVLQALRNQNERITVHQAVSGVKRLTDLGSKYRQLLFSLDGVEVLVGLLKPSGPESREIIFKILIDVCTAGDAQKVAIVECRAVRILLGFLQKNPIEKSSALQLLYELSKVAEGKSAIASEKGVMLILATAYNTSPENRRLQIRTLLDNLCKDDIHMILKAAESTLLEPLVASLSSENDNTKLELVSALLESFDLNEFNSVALVNAGIVPPLLTLVQEGSSESMSAAVRLLLQLSSTQQNRLPLAKAGAIRVLVKYLAYPSDEIKVHVTAVLSNLATDRQNAHEIDSEGAVSRLFKMMKSKDCLLQEYSLRTLGSMARDSTTVRNEVVELGMVPSFYAFLESGELSAASQRNMLAILRHATKDSENVMAVAPSATGLRFLVDRLECDTVEEKEAVFVILEAVAQVEELALLMLSFEKLLISCAVNLTGSNLMIQESAAGLLAKFASLGIMRTGVKLVFSEYDVFSGLVKLLDNDASTKMAKEHAAEAVYWLSSCTHNLSAPVSTAFGCLAGLGIRKFRACAVHGGKCSAKETFCLVEAGAISSLIKVIPITDVKTAGWAVKSLNTLIGVSGSSNRREGIDLLMKSGVLVPVVRLVGDEQSSTEEAIRLLEKIFRSKKYRNAKYSNVARTVLMQKMAMGDAEARRLSATALMHLDMIPTDTSYTNTSV